MSVYQYSVPTPQGEERSLKEYEGKVLLIVNTATECGFTPQYENLADFHKKYADQGLVIIDIPSNQFGGQAPGSDEEIQSFCKLNFGTPYPQMAKSDVNGENELDLYTYLKSQKGFEGFTGEEAEDMDKLLAGIDPDFKNNPKIKWNFTKFLIDREGQVVARFEPTEDMAKVEEAIKELL
ncbi:MAG: glutathione peroxidase [Tissierellia bacterium]|nr:glutathione peroxidase [Tissierellia bacterium]